VEKIVFIAASYERVSHIIDKYQIDGGYWISSIDAERVIVVAYPRHHATRFMIADEDGITVLPSRHDTEPIGDLHQHLSHVDAKPHHTSREIHHRLHAAHGPEWSPDT